MYAAPFNNNDYMDKINDTDTPINRKKNANNKTQKRYYPKDKPMYSDKVNSILQKIHNLPEQNDEELADFNDLLPRPISAGVENTKDKDPTTAKEKESFVSNNLSSYVSPLMNNNHNGHNDDSLYSNLNANTTDMSFANSTDYGRFIPDYSKMYNNTETVGKNNYKTMGGVRKGANDILIEKLNYMITLLEKQESEKTNNVTEEVILYSFLGIFIIFIVDSFARVGKYVR